MDSSSLRENGEYLKDIFETLSEGVALNEMIFDERGSMVDYRILEVNRAFYQYADMMENQPVIGNRATLLYGMTQPVIEAFFEKHRQVTDTQQEIYQSPGSGRWFLIATSPFKNNRFITTFQDITEQQIAQKLLLRQKTMLARTEQLARIGSWEWEIASDLVTWSEELFRLFRLEPQPQAPSFAEHSALYQPESWARLMAAVSQATQDGRNYEMELMAIRSDGSPMICWARGFSEFNSDGTVERLYGSLQDITDERTKQREHENLQAQLLQSQKLENLGLLAGGMAHDMNNVLAAISAIAATQLQVLPAESRPYRSFSTIAQAVKRGGSLVSGLLQFTRKKPALVKSIDLNSLIEEQMALLAHTTLSQIAVEAHLEPELPPISGDESALSLVLMNLWINAVDAMRDQDREKILTVTTEHRGPVVAVVIADNGPGMSAEVQQRLGEPYFTTKAAVGTGLGLYLTYGIVKSHNGEISFHSEPRTGTTVTLTFPLAPVPEPEVVPALARVGVPRSKKVLLVDDDPDVRETTTELLNVLGCQVVGRPNGETALECLGQGLLFDLVILDMNMPGLGGIKTLREIRRLRPQLEVVVSTGLADQSVLDLVAQVPRTTLLPKPFEVSFLKTLLDRAPDGSEYSPLP